MSSGIRRIRPALAAAAVVAAVAAVAFPHPVAGQIPAETVQPRTGEVPRARTDPAAVSPAFPYAAPEEVGLSGEELGRLADSVAQWVADGRLMGAEVVIIKDGRTVLHEVAGWNDRQRGLPLRRHSIYRIRSMTKPFISTAVLLLVEEGKLGLDDVVADYLPAFDNERSRGITVRALLTHTSGLRDHGRLDIGLPKPADEYDSLRELVDDIGEIGPLEPVGVYHYSDSGSSTLAALVAELAGMPVERFVEQRIIRPLGLEDTHTRFTPDAPWAGRMNSTHRWSEDLGGFERYWDPTREQRFRYFRGSGGLYSSAVDYARFMAVWMAGGRHAGGRLLSAASVRAALRPLTGSYGLHWQVWGEGYDDGPDVFGHGGSDGTLALAFPALDAMVLYFTQSRYASRSREFRGLLRGIPAFAGHVPDGW